MPSIGFTQNSVLSSGNQTYSLASLITIPSGADKPAVLALRAYDRDKYGGEQSFDYGKFSSANGGTISAGTQNHATFLYFDLKDGVYVSRSTGEALGSYTFLSSDQNHRSVYLSLFTSDAKDATFRGDWLDPAWNHLSDLNLVTRTDFVDPTPNQATPAEIAAIAKSFIGQVWNGEGCWLLTSNISAAAGASLPALSAQLDTADISGNGQWQVVFNGGLQNGDWRALLQVGDVVELGYLNGQAHIATVTSGSGHGAMWVDNSGEPAKDGVAGDIVIQGEHAVDLWTANALDNSVIVFRLGTASSAPNGQVAPVAPPLVTAHGQSIHVGQSLSVASLFSVQDPNLQAMQSYQIIDHGASNHIVLNGAQNLAAPEQAGVVIVSAADLGKLSYVAGLGPDQLTITAFNGQTWGSVKVVVTGWIDPPPAVVGASLALHASSQVLPVAGLFTASAAPGHSISQYRFIDTNHTGQLVMHDARLNLATNDEMAQGIVRLNASDLDTLGWKVLADTGTVSVSVFDGVQWSDFAAVTVAGQNTAPVVTPLARTNVSVGQAVPVTSMFTLSDQDHDAITMVSIYDFFDNIQLNGATDYCPFPHAYQVTLADLPKVTYTASGVMGGLQGISVYAYDGTSWSSQTAIDFTIDDPHPELRPGASNGLALNQSIALSQLFGAVDPHGKAITTFKVQDPAGGGSVELNGAVNLATASERQAGISVFAFADLPKVSYRAGASAGGESLQISAFDGSLWGTATFPVYSTDNSSPTVLTPAATLDLGRTVALASLFNASSPSGKPITSYLIHDPAGAGHIVLNGAHDLASAGQQGNGVLIAADEIGMLGYVVSASAATEALGVSAFDGSSWGQGEVLVTAKNFGRPVVTGTTLTVHAGQSLSLQDLFGVSDPSASPIVGYQVYDSGQHLQLNGAINYYAADQYKGWYSFLPTDLAKVVVVAGEPGTQSFVVEAANKLGATSQGDSVTLTVLPNPVVTPTTVTVAIHQTVALSDLFSASNPSGKPLLEYSITDTDSAGSLFLNGATNLASASEQAHGVTIVSAADLARLTFMGADAFSADHLNIAAFDGDSWGGFDVPVTTIDGTAPRIVAGNASVELHTTVPVSSLFGATSHSGAPIITYKIIDPNGGGKLALGGAANAATPAQQAQQGMAIIAAADLAKLSYVGADMAGAETLTVSAFDGQSWGTAYLDIASVKTDPPQVQTHPTYLEPGQLVPLKSLFAVSDPAGHAPAFYVFQDGSGNIVLNGAVNLWAQQENAGYYWIAAADIDKVGYQPHADGVYRYSMIINDGYNFSTWTSGLAVAGQERLNLPPSVLPATTTVALQQTLPLASLFTVNDVLGNAMTTYRVRDGAGAGSVLAPGVTDLASASEHAQGYFVFAAADLAMVHYQGGAAPATETLGLGAYDGQVWGDADIAISSAVLPPVIAATGVALELNAVRNLSALFSLSVASGGTVTQYKVQDPAGGGTLLLNGATNLADGAAQAAGISVFSALDLARVEYASAAQAGSETLLIGAYDGASWGAANLSLATVDNRAPLIGALAHSVDLGKTVHLDTLFKASSVNGKPVVEYQISDPAGGGSVILNNAHNLASAQQQSAGITVVTAYELHDLLYTGALGAGSETLVITASDGQHASSANINIDSVTPILPVVTPTPITIHAGESVRLSDLVGINDPNGHAITWVYVTDADLGINLNGAANLAVSPYYDFHGHYDFNNLADWGKILYVGQQPGTVRIGVQVEDGYAVSSYVEQVITVVAPGALITPTPQTVTAGGAGNDRFAPSGVNNLIDGGAGIDTLAMPGKQSAYVLVHDGDGGFTVESALDGVVLASMHNVERLQFDDATFALDVGALANQGAGGATLASAGQVFRLYQAAFDRAPDTSGLAFWVAQADAGVPLSAIAAGFAVSAEFRDLVGGLSEHQFVEQLYQNILHRGAEAAGATYWNGLLDGHVLTREQALLGFSESQENQAALVGVLSHGIVLA